MKNERDVYKKFLEKEVEVVGIIKEIREGHSEPYKNVINDNVIQMAKRNKKISSPICFVGKRYLVKEAKIGDEKIGDGHIWIVEDIGELKGIKVGDKISIFGTVKQYKKKHGKLDYCIRPRLFKKID